MEGAFLLFCIYLFESAILLPIAITVACAGYALSIIASNLHNVLLILSLEVSNRPRAPLKVLVIGSGSAGGLLTARALHKDGHVVIGADVEHRFLPSASRLSRAITKFCALRNPNSSYGPWLLVKDIVSLIEREHIKLWINCSNQISATDCSEIQQALDQKHIPCASFALPTSLATAFQCRSNFLNTLRRLGLPTPERWEVGSRSEVHNRLNEANGTKKYTLANGTGAPALVLPRRTLSQTYSDVARIKISRENPWFLEQHLEQTESFTAFAIIVRGSLKALAVGTKVGASSSLQAVQSRSVVGQYITGYMSAIAERLDEEFTCQLSVDFHAIEKATTAGCERALLPVDCSLESHPAQLLLSDHRQRLALAHCYLSICDDTKVLGLSSNDKSSQTLFPSPTTTGVFSIGAELVELTAKPLWALITLNASLSGVLGSWVELARYVVYWDEAVFTLWDPWPALWLYHVSLPILLGSETLKKSKRSLVGHDVSKK